eukprot:TRINITY_DN9560_c0_g1_i4.p2 TRINITY_DN9560_c0_g1~~TRINITY_DN9560_c0_g1_i4.p2  ORF type:complete len:130 (+),score=33.57 TRINITY_DN9560_c0_g1_i4:242-631(+)
MGFLADGEAMKWAEASKHADYIRKHGIKQFLHLYRRLKSRCNDTFLWGDEVEYIVCKKDEDKKQVRLKLNAHEMLGELERLSTEAQDECGRPQAHFLPEYGGVMLEATPRGPDGGTRGHYFSVGANKKV